MTFRSTGMLPSRQPEKTKELRHGLRRPATVRGAHPAACALPRRGGTRPAPRGRTPRATGPPRTCSGRPGRTARRPPAAGGRCTRRRSPPPTPPGRRRSRPPRRRRASGMPGRTRRPVRNAGLRGARARREQRRRRRGGRDDEEEQALDFSPSEGGGPTARAVGVSASSPTARPEFSVEVLHQLHRQTPSARRPEDFSPRSRPGRGSCRSHTSTRGR